MFSSLSIHIPMNFSGSSEVRGFVLNSLDSCDSTFENCSEPPPHVSSTYVTWIPSKFDSLRI